ncbi:endogenous retrovirus group K member 6 Pro protein-like [Corvus hawaiiensis]|uniref:endogenous retrovirus group K member 6 Pro protein-like n=1 Tax=Corvus hawaiiensis TaxID=134902 RepID=UPI002018CBD0|nr:endogenous retrovirus group K member 6 Pro protein-like [Corvus hawaiiensis]
MWIEIVGSNKPTIECSLFCKGERVYRPGMLDTGADVTIIARSEWPGNWELEPVAGMISGIGGIAVSMRSKRNVVIEGPEGKIATTRPFVVRAPITLWGRDLLSQWGATLTIPSQDF